MSSLNIDLDLLRKFEQNLDPRFPERNPIPTRVLGYGEISTVLEIGEGSGLAYKRLPMFETEAEAVEYVALYWEVVTLFQEKIGLHLPRSEVVHFTSHPPRRLVLYIVQEKVAPESIGNKAIQRLSTEDISRLVLIILEEISKVFQFNREQAGELRVAIDSQISNWSIVGFDPTVPVIPAEPKLVYLDTSTPLLQKHGVEQINPELFLRNTPSFMRWVIRKFFLKEVMTHYYDFHKVTIDLIANFYKEQRPELIPGLVELANRFFSTRSSEASTRPITPEEIRNYYQQDALTWRVYLSFRKFDRSLHGLMKKEYPYILPGNIKR